MNGRNDSDASYDPRSWGRVHDRPPSMPIASPPPTPDRPSPQGRFGRLAELSAGLTVALVGAALAYSARVAEPAPRAAAPPPAAGERIEQRILNLPSLDRIATSLRALGIAAGEADSAAAIATGHLGTDKGEVRLDLTMVEDGAAGRIRTLVATHADGGGVEVTRATDGTLAAKPITARLVRRLRFVRGELDGQSFYSSAVAAGVSDVLVGAFANAFRYDFDMQREVNAGDVFEAGFEQRYNAAGEAVGSPTLVYASLSTPAKTRALYRAPGNDGAEWFDAVGRSSQRSLMRTPVEAARISSGFGMRGHPILGFVKMHRGTDFAAPTGTPIFAAGDATVSFAGPKGANGNFVRLHHNNGWETLYLHMNRIAPGIVLGTRVAQGTQIGEVGTTGRSTGPHLHYEVHINGQPVNPMSIETGGGRTLGGSALAAFRKVRDAVDTRRADAD